MVKYYKEFHWMFPLTDTICIKMQDKLEVSYWKYQKQPSEGK